MRWKQNQWTDSKSSNLEGKKKKKIPWTFYEDNGSQDIIEKLIQENLPELEDTQNQIK